MTTGFKYGSDKNPISVSVKPNKFKGFFVRNRNLLWLLIPLTCYVILFWTIIYSEAKRNVKCNVTCNVSKLFESEAKCTAFCYGMR